jgi:NADPH:quinone reductase-like Zn-dependent oxidoreductase
MSEINRVASIEGSFGLENIRIAEKPVPEPGPRQVLVRMRAASLNFRDYLVATGRYNPKMPLPRVLLSDGAGEVAALGAGVSRVKPGDRVAGTFFQTWLAGDTTEFYGKSALGGAIDGVLADYVVFEEDGLVHIPAHLSYQEAATLPCAAVTAWNALVAQGKLKAGESVLVQGTGGVSIFALQIAKMQGARVIVTSSSDAKLDRARALGADETINYKQTPDWDKRARQLTGIGVDHVVEVGGSGTLAKSLNSVRVSGRVSVIGVLTGIAGELMIAPILHKHITVQGIYVGSREMFEALNRAIALQKLQPVVDRVFPMEQIQDGLRLMESAAHFGKIVISLET